MTEKEAIEKLVRLFTQEDSLKEEIKAEKDEIKEAGFNVAVLSSVAKAMVNNKVDELLEKNELIAAAVEVARS
jgi:uncharacterized protein (UPF0335 family)